MLLAFDMDVYVMKMNVNHVIKKHSGRVTYLIMHDTHP